MKILIEILNNYISRSVLTLVIFFIVISPTANGFTDNVIWFYGGCLFLVIAIMSMTMHFKFMDKHRLLLLCLIAGLFTLVFYIHYNWG